MPKKTKERNKKLESKKLSSAEFEKKVFALAKEGLTSEKIGEALREEGIHSKEHKVKISKILKEKQLYQNPDLKNVEKKLEKLKTHYAKNKQDKRAKREIDRISAQLRKLKKYFKAQ